MGRDDDTPPTEFEFVSVGPTDGSDDEDRSQRRWPRWLPLLLAGTLAAAAVVTVVIRANSKPSVAPTTRTAVHLSPSEPNASSGTGSAGSSPPPVLVTELGHLLLGVTAGWELFGRGDGVVIRIQPALGRITRTTVPEVQSGGPVSFVAGADQAIIRPIDYVPGYVVPDGQPAREMSARLSQGGPAFPGPDLNHVWVESGDNSHAVMVLAALDGIGHGVSVPVPANTFPTADGAGYLIFTGSRGSYDARPDGLHRITNGSLMAVGPTGWLVVECNNQHRCTSVVIHRADGSRHVVDTSLDVNAPPGVISPNGTTAAVFKAGPTNTITLALVNLRSGSQQPVDLSLDQRQVNETVVWSPDSRWLFAVGANGRLWVVDGYTASVTDLDTPPLPRLSELAIRSGPPN